MKFNIGDKIKLDSSASESICDILKNHFGKEYKDYIYEVVQASDNYVILKDIESWDLSNKAFIKYNNKSDNTIGDIDKVKKLIKTSVEYLLDGELLEENGWTKEDLIILNALMIKDFEIKFK